MSPVMKVAGVLRKDWNRFGSRARLATSVIVDRSMKY